MDIVQEALSEIESGNVAYMNFALDYRNNAEHIYCFYEGNEDRSFYSHRIRDSFNTYTYFDYITIGKDKLIKAYELIENHQEYKKSTITFFIDRDFEPPVENPDIYCTKTYSIENLYVHQETFKNIMLNEFSINHRHGDYDKIIEIYEALKNEFLQKSITLNAWLACQTDLRLSSGISTRLKIDKTIKSLLDSTVKNDFSGILFPDELGSKESIELLFSSANTIDNITLNAKILLFNELNLEEATRGKFLNKFLVSFLCNLKNEIGKKESTVFAERHICRLRFEELTSISQLTNSVITPKELFDYFDFIKEKAGMN